MQEPGSTFFHANRCRGRQWDVFPFKLVLLCFVLTVVSGCLRLGPRERGILQRASQLVSSGQYNDAVTQLNRIIPDYDSAEEIGEAYYLRGVSFFHEGRLDAAEKDFRRALAKAKRADLKAYAQASLGTIAFRRSQWDRAADYFKASVGKLPNEPPTDQLLYTAGLAMRRAGDWDEAKFQFARVLREFRGTEVAQLALHQATWHHPFFSIQLGVYRDARNATQAVEGFRQRGIQAVRESKARYGESMWVVRSGQYSTYSAALSALPSLRRVQPDAVIIP